MFVGINIFQGIDKYVAVGSPQFVVCVHNDTLVVGQLISARVYLLNESWVYNLIDLDM